MAIDRALFKNRVLKDAVPHRSSKGEGGAKATNVHLPNEEVVSRRPLVRKVPRTLWRNAERYLGLLAGFFLFLAPFALFTRLSYGLVGGTGEANIHSLCFKLPMDLLINGTVASTIGPVAVAFVIGILIVSLLFGPLFCGRLCPVGAMSEMLSRIVPLPDRYRVRIQNTKLTIGLRYGFLAGFILVAGVMGGQVAQCSYGVDLGRYCGPGVMEYLSLGLFATPPANFWNTGAVLTLIMWLVLGGILMVGGRGWCLFFCPLGAMSGISHALGARLGLYHLEHDASKCRDCRRCEVQCPMWAIKVDGKVEPALCIGCRECINNCSFGSYRGTFGRASRLVRPGSQERSVRTKGAGAFTLAAASAPMVYLLSGPCASTGCGACPLGGACALSIPLLYGGLAFSKGSSRLRVAWASLRARIRGRKVASSDGG